VSAGRRKAREGRKSWENRTPGSNYEMTTTATATAAAAAASTVIADITNNVKCTKLWPQNEKRLLGKKVRGRGARAFACNQIKYELGLAQLKIKTKTWQRLLVTKSETSQWGSQPDCESIVVTSYQESVRFVTLAVYKVINPELRIITASRLRQSNKSGGLWWTTSPKYE